MPLPKKYHTITFMSILVMLLLLGLYLLSGGYSQPADSQTAGSRAAALARNSTTANHLSSSSNNVFSSSQQPLPAYRHPIVYDKLTGATNNQINDVLGANSKQPNHLISDYPIDHYQQQQQQQQHQSFHPNLLADPQQQQRHRQQMLDRQMLFGGPNQVVNPFGPPPPPPPPLSLDFPANQTNQQPNYYPDATLYRQQQQQPLPMMQPPPTNQQPIRPPYAHLAPLNMPPMSQYEQQQPASSQQLKPAAQSRIIPLNSRIDPTTTSAAPQPPPAQSQGQQQQQPQMVLASNQAPPKTSNSILLPPPASFLSTNRLASQTAAPSCVRQQVDQQQQQVPSGAADSSNGTIISRPQMPVLFCNIDTEYPTKEIMRALEAYSQEQKTIEHLLPQLLIQLHIQAQPARQLGGNHQFLTLDQLQSSLVSSQPTTTVWQNSSAPSQTSAEKQFPSANFEQMCRSTIQMAQPRRAKNLAGQWKIVVNLPGHKYRGIAISQMVRVEECSAPLGECATPSMPSVGLAKSSCLQHYENQRLIAWSPQQGLHMDMFRMPVACSCHIRRS